MRESLSACAAAFSGTLRCRQGLAIRLFERERECRFDIIKARRREWKDWTKKCMKGHRRAQIEFVDDRLTLWLRRIEYPKAKAPGYALHAVGHAG